MKKKLLFLTFGLFLLSGCSGKTETVENNQSSAEKVENVSEQDQEEFTETNENIDDYDTEDSSEWSLEDFKGLTSDNCPYNFEELMSSTGMNCKDFSDKYGLNIEDCYPDNGIDLSNENGLSVCMYAYSNDYQSPYFKDSWDGVKISGIIPTWNGIYIGSTLNNELTDQWKGKTVGEYNESWNNEEQGYTLSFVEYHQNVNTAFVVVNKDANFSTEKQYIIHVKPVIPGDKFIKTATLNQDDQSEYFDTAEITAIYETPFDYDKITWYSSIPDFDDMIGKTIEEFQAANPNYIYNSGSFTDLDGMNSFMFSPYENKMESCNFYAWYDENKVIQKITKD